MNNKKLIGACVIAGQLLFASAGFAVGVDITVSDYLPGPYRQTPSGEDNETEPNTIQAQSWDLERLVAGAVSGQPKSLSLIGGYDFKNGNSGYHPGDIWIDVDSGALPAGIGGPNGYQLQTQTPSSLGYDFVVHFMNRNASNVADPFKLIGTNWNQYQIYDLRSAASISFYDVYFQQNNAANPFVWVSGGAALGATQNAGYGLIGDATATNSMFGSATGWEAVTPWAGKGADTHYYLDVNLAAITSILGVSLDEAKFTMGCGNDMIVGDFTKGHIQLPDGGLTVMMIGFALTGLAALARRFAP